MVYKKGAFVAGLLSMGIGAGKRAEKMLKARAYADEAEMQAPEVQIKTGKSRTRRSVR